MSNTSNLIDCRVGGDMSMKQAFKALGGVWPDEVDVGNCTKLYECLHTIGYYAAPDVYIGYNLIGTREEFEACRKEKWHVWSGRGEIPTGVTRVLMRWGNLVSVEWLLDRSDGDIVAYTCE